MNTYAEIGSGMFCVILEETHRCNLASMQLHRCDFECCVNKWLHRCKKSCIDARLKRWKVEETNHLIHFWKSSNPHWDWQWFFLQIVFKGKFLNSCDPNKINIYGFCLVHVFLSKVEFFLQNGISLKVVQRWECDGIPKPYYNKFLFMLCCFFPHNRYSHNCWLPLVVRMFCYSGVASMQPHCINVTSNIDVTSNVVCHFVSSILAPTQGWRGGKWKRQWSRYRSVKHFSFWTDRQIKT